MTKPAPFPSNLTQFKNWLTQPGVRLKGHHHGIAPPPGFYTPRKVVSVSNTEFVLEGDPPAHAGFRSSKAWAFDPDARTATLTLNAPTTHGAPRKIVYELISS